MPAWNETPLHGLQHTLLDCFTRVRSGVGGFEALLVLQNMWMVSGEQYWSVGPAWVSVIIDLHPTCQFTAYRALETCRILVNHLLTCWPEGWCYMRDSTAVVGSTAAMLAAQPCHSLPQPLSGPGSDRHRHGALPGRLWN